MGAWSQDRRGAALVFASAAVWSFGGAIARFLSVSDSWVVVFWRSVFAAAFLICFMGWRNGLRGSVVAFRSMGLPGLGVGVCFAIASTAFVVALSYTTVANVLLMQAGVPLIAALMTYLLFGEKVSLPTWAAIVAVLVGVAVMVSGSFAGQLSPVGDGLALLIAVVFASATVITRRHANLGMMPAVTLGSVIAGLLSGAMASTFRVSGGDAVLLFLFGALNLGLGMALFVTGVRLIPSALAALVGVAEPVLGPVWVWLVHGEVPGVRTLVGGGIVFLALVLHLGWQFSQQQSVSVMPMPD
jgi:drug/metabolite transporter (DMT)-like permease